MAVKSPLYLILSFLQGNVICVKIIAFKHAPHIVFFKFCRRYQKLQKIMKPW